jgi:Tfp pilus assembly major pilin PilA
LKQSNKVKPVAAVADISGVKTESKDLKLALRNWVDVMLLRDGWPEDDAPWWYNERASVSQLAGAVWRCGPKVKPSWVLEEYATPRYGARGSKATRGRCDILVELGELRFIAEAKQLWFDKSRDGDCSGRLRKALDEAHEQVVTAPNDGGRYQQFALAFVVPVITASLNRDPDRLHQHIASVVESAQREAPRASFAWAFPASRRFNLESHRYKGNFFPGCVLVLEPTPA